MWWLWSWSDAEWWWGSCCCEEASCITNFLSHGFSGSCDACTWSIHRTKRPSKAKSDKTVWVMWYDVMVVMMVWRWLTMRSCCCCCCCCCCGKARQGAWPKLCLLGTQVTTIDYAKRPSKAKRDKKEIQDSVSDGMRLIDGCDYDDCEWWGSCVDVARQ